MARVIMLPPIRRRGQWRPYLISLSAATADALTISDVTGGTPVVDTPTIGQVHALSISDVTGGTPVVDAPTVGQAHALTISDVAGGTPVVDAPTVGQAHALTISDVAGGTPVVDTPTLNPEISYQAGGNAWSTTQSSRTITRISNTGTQFVLFRLSSYTATVTPPSGWTLLDTGVQGTTYSLHLLYKVMAPGEPSSWNFPFSETVTMTVTSVVYQNLDPVTPIDDYAVNVETGSATSHDTGEVTNTDGYNWVAIFKADDYGSTPPSGYTERKDYGVGTDTIGIDDTAAGVVPGAYSETWTTASASTSVSFIVVLDALSNHTVHALTINDVDGGTPAVDAPTLGQTHALTINDVTGGTPVVDAPTLSEGSHALTINDVTGGTPVVDTPTIGQAHVLTISDVTGGTPAVDAPALDPEITYLTSGWNFGTNNQYNPSSSHTDGDLYFIGFKIDDVALTVTPTESGWNLVDTATQGTSYKLWVFYKIESSSDSPVQQFTWGSSASYQVTYVKYRYADPVTPVATYDSFVETGSVSSHVTAEISNIDSYDWIATFFVDTGASTPPSGYTERREYPYPGSADGIGVFDSAAGVAPGSVELTWTSATAGQDASIIVVIDALSNHAVHALTINDVTGGTPVVDTPTLSEAGHSLTINDVTGGTPVVDTPTLGQVHAVAIGDVTGGTPVVDTPTLGQVHALTISDVTTGAPIVDTPSVAEGISQLTINDVTGGTPVVDTPTLGQVHALTISDVTAGTPVVDAPTLSQVNALAISDVTGGTPVVDAPTVGIYHALTIEDVLAGAPVVDAPTLGQTHDLLISDLFAGVPQVDSPSIGGPAVIINLAPIVTPHPIRVHIAGVAPEVLAGRTLTPLEVKQQRAMPVYIVGIAGNYTVQTGAAVLPAGVYRVDSDTEPIPTYIAGSALDDGVPGTYLGRLQTDVPWPWYIVGTVGPLPIIDNAAGPQPPRLGGPEKATPVYIAGVAEVVTAGYSLDDKNVARSAAGKYLFVRNYRAPVLNIFISGSNDIKLVEAP